MPRLPLHLPPGEGHRSAAGAGTDRIRAVRIPLPEGVKEMSEELTANMTLLAVKLEQIILLLTEMRDDEQSDRRDSRIP